MKPILTLIFLIFSTLSFANNGISNPDYVSTGISCNGEQGTKISASLIYLINKQNIDSLKQEKVSVTINGLKHEFIAEDNDQIIKRDITISGKPIGREISLNKKLINGDKIEMTIMIFDNRDGSYTTGGPATITFRHNREMDPISMESPFDHLILKDCAASSVVHYES